MLYAFLVHSPVIETHEWGARFRQTAQLKNSLSFYNYTVAVPVSQVCPILKRVALKKQDRPAAST